MLAMPSFIPAPPIHPPARRIEQSGEHRALIAMISHKAASANASHSGNETSELEVNNSPKRSQQLANVTYPGPHQLARPRHSRREADRWSPLPDHPRSRSARSFGEHMERVPVARRDLLNLLHLRLKGWIRRRQNIRVIRPLKKNYMLPISRAKATNHLLRKYEPE